MATTTSSNKNNSAVKRIMQEARELANDPSTDYTAAPLEDDIFEWHCTIRGPAGTEFEGGLYHLRILLPAEYPFRPPSLMVLTPNGRFELNTKICISFTNYHEELWQPAWGVRTAILGIQGFFPLRGQAAVGVGSIEYPSAERKRLAALSREWVCPHCQQSNLDLLPDPPSSSSSGSGTTSPEPEIETTPEVNSNTPAVTVTSDVSSSPSSPPEANSRSNVSSDDHVLGTDSSSTAPPIPAPAIPTSHSTSHFRPPVFLDALIGLILALVFALLFKRIF
ncbi:UBC-like protein [Lentinula raphanica]|uniref:UBC-like protein n=1 Tax=Lentinula raphanica TaxID=153919 RepID=A0AA38UI40_9AGAR|nr:UBC-like protein [Lentinula raphanica]KAJ3842070.1 UBC-like protein [Lentinula raphanica]KAJ3969117.1 UBC-like protein [Lentinula raphanica]